MSSSWADAENELPAPQVIENDDGTKTVITYKYNDQNKKVKITQRIKLVKVTENVNPAIASRRKWNRFGSEKNNATVGPDARTTQFGEEVKLVLGVAWKEEEEKEEEEKKKALAKERKSTIICRTCGGDHFTSKCPFKDTLGSETKTEQSNLNPLSGSDVLSAGPQKGTYIPPSQRRKMAGGNGPSDSSMGMRERDDTTSLRVTNLNSQVNEDILRSLFGKFGEVERVVVLRNRETRESKGVAFVEMDTIPNAEAAKNYYDGKGVLSLIISVDWSKPKKT